MTYTVLLAVDGSMPSLVATKKAVEHAREKNGELVIMYVSEQTPLVKIEKIAEDLALDRRCPIDFVAFAVDYASKSGIPARVIYRSEPVAGEIVRASEEISADLIIMGSTNPKGLDGLMLGNVAEAVLKTATCSVWTIKPNPEELTEILELVRAIAHPKKAPVLAVEPDGGLFRMAIGLLTIYLLGYGAFTLGGTYFRDIMSARLLGMNVAIVFGMVIIMGAIVIALFYSWYAGRFEPGTEV
ncbi:MAG: universal stress protein [Methanoregula sp.]|nr:universal stress protein [Methanoregula sp.]